MKNRKINFSGVHTSQIHKSNTFKKTEMNSASSFSGVLGIQVFPESKQQLLMILKSNANSSYIWSLAYFIYYTSMSKCMSVLFSKVTIFCDPKGNYWIVQEYNSWTWCFLLKIYEILCFKNWKYTEWWFFLINKESMRLMIF